MKKWIIGILLTLIMAFFMMPVSAKAVDAPSFKAVYDSADNSLTFFYDSASHSGTVYPLLTAAGSANAWGYDSVRESVITVKIDSSVAGFHDLTSTAYMFANMKKANTIDGAEYLDVSHVTDMSYMFYYFGYLEMYESVAAPNVRDWDTGSLTTATSMFEYYGVNHVTDAPDVSIWNTKNLRDASSMFRFYAKNDLSFNGVPDVSKWDTRNITNAELFMSGYAFLSESIDFILDLSGWKLPKYGNSNPLFSDNTATRTENSWKVIIPESTGGVLNTTTVWNVGGGNKLTLPYGRSYTLYKPAGKYYSSLMEALETTEEGLVKWAKGDALPLEALRLLVVNPKLSLEFTFAYQEEEHTITIPAGSFEKYYDESIPWYGPAWLLQYYGNPQSNTIEYIIAKDDTLNDIAKKFNCTVDEILALNTFITNPNRIYANTKLLIPAK